MASTPPYPNWDGTAGWEDQGQTRADLSTGTPPWGYLAASAVCLLLSGLLLGLWRASPTASFVAWLLAGFGSLTFVGLFLGADTRRRSADIYFGHGWSKSAYTALAMLSVILCAVAAWFFADWVGRR